MNEGGLFHRVRKIFGTMRVTHTEITDEEAGNLPQKKGADLPAIIPKSKRAEEDFREPYLSVPDRSILDYTWDEKRDKRRKRAEEAKREESKKAERRRAVNTRIHEILEQIHEKKKHIEEMIREYHLLDRGVPNYCERHDVAITLMEEFNYNIKKVGEVYEITIQVPGKEQTATGYHRHLAFAMCEMFIRLYEGEFDSKGSLKQLEAPKDSEPVEKIIERPFAITETTTVIDGYVMKVDVDDSETTKSNS